MNCYLFVALLAILVNIVYAYDAEVNEFANSSTTTHIWKLPIKVTSSFSSLLSCLEKKRGHLLKNFSLNAPLLEELFVSLDRELEEKKKDQQGQVKPIQLPKIEKVSKPGILKAALRLCQYRIRVYLRQKTYWFMGILLPVIILLIILPGYNEKLTKLKFYSFEKR